MLTTLDVKSPRCHSSPATSAPRRGSCSHSDLGPVVLVVTHQDGDPDPGEPGADAICDEACPKVCDRADSVPRLPDDPVAADLAERAGGKKAIRILMGDFNVTPTPPRYRSSSPTGGSTPPRRRQPRVRPATGARLHERPPRRRGRRPEGPERTPGPADRLPLREAAGELYGPVRHARPTATGTASAPESGTMTAVDGPGGMVDSSPTTAARRGIDFVRLSKEGLTHERRPGHQGRHRRRRHRCAGPARRRRRHRRPNHRDRRRARRRARRSTPPARSSPPGSSTSTRTTTPRCSGTRRSRRRRGTASPRVVAGNCGFSIAPCRPEHRELLVPHARARRGHEPGRRSTRASRGTSRRSPSTSTRSSATAPSSTTRAYIGHTAVRLYVMGDDGLRRAEATDDELARMADVVREAVDAGAAGFASSSSATHSGDGGRPVPSRLADVRELEALLTPLRRAGRGVVELLAGRADQAPGRLRPANARSGGRSRGPRCSRSRATRGTRAWPSSTPKNAPTGADVWPQVSVRPLTFSMNHGRAVHVQHVPDLRRAHGQARRGEDRRVSAIPNGGGGRRTSSTTASSSGRTGSA